MGSAKHVEAYPRINLIRDFCNLHAGRVVAKFATERDQWVGELFQLGRSESHLLIGYSFDPREFQLHEGVEHLRIARIAVGIHKQRSYFRCGGCGKRVGVLVYNEAWGCKECLGLCYRTKLISKDTTRWEEIRALQELIGQGRPPRMHQPTYEQLCGRLHFLRESAGPTQAVANTGHLRIIRTEWYAPGDQPWLTHSQFTIEEGKIVPRAKPRVESPMAPTGGTATDARLQTEAWPPAGCVRMDPNALFGPTKESPFGD